MDRQQPVSTDLVPTGRTRSQPRLSRRVRFLGFASGFACPPPVVRDKIRSILSYLISYIYLSISILSYLYLSLPVVIVLSLSFSPVGFPAPDFGAVLGLSNFGGPKKAMFDR